METRQYDIACIGGGGAGINSALAALRDGAKVLLMSKEPVGYGNTRISGGVMATCGIDLGDSPDILYDDLLSAGDELNNPKLARVMADEARFSGPIGEGLGQLFRRDADGTLSRLVRPGGHRFRRGLAQPGRGKGFGHALRAAVARAGVDVLEETTVVKLLTFRDRIAGLVAWNLNNGEPVVVQAKAVILACGGFAALYYPHTDGMRGAVGDGLALAFDAGATLVDMEQIQFMPFGCVHPKSMIGLLLGEPATAGPRGRLLDRHGRVVLTGIDTMTRGRVSRAIASEVRLGNGTEYGGLVLDLRPNLERESGLEAWQRVSQTGALDTVRRAYGAKAARWEEPWDVCPMAHFSVGGVRIDADGATSVPGLFAVGEIAGGVHGGDRLGSVALAEAYVFGRRAGSAAVQFARGSDGVPFPNDEAAAAVAWLESLCGARGEHRPITLLRELQRVMWDGIGVVRDHAGLNAALREVGELARQAESLSISRGRVYNHELLEAIEVIAGLKVAKVAASSALLRTESRGGHFRDDFPRRDDARWMANITARQTDGGLRLELEPIERG